jgi:hypothetical protein
VSFSECTTVAESLPDKRLCKLEAKNIRGALNGPVLKGHLRYILG